MSTKVKKSKGKKSAKKKAAPKKKLSLAETRKRNKSKRLKKEADHRRYLKKKKAAAKPVKKRTIIPVGNKGKGTSIAITKTDIGLNGKVIDHEKNMTTLANVAEEMAAQRHDEVNHPNHYTSGKIEVIDFIEDQKLDLHTGSAVKYIARAGKKDPNKEITDLEKAEWYIRRKINNLKKAKEAAAPKKLDIRSSDGKK